MNRHSQPPHAILGRIGRQISELHQTDDWAILPPTRASKEVKEQQSEEQAKDVATGVRAIREIAFDALREAERGDPESAQAWPLA